MIRTGKKGIEMLSFDRLSAYGDIFNFVTTRNGAEAGDAYSSFDLGVSGDRNICIVESNRKRLCDVLGIDTSSLILPYQVHGDKILEINEEWFSLPGKDRSMALAGIDGLITSMKNIAIGVTTADCVPLLLYDPEKKVVAAVHAGWRGTVNGIAAGCVQKMIALYDCDPRDVIVGIGPSISISRFEVGEEVVLEFRDAGFPMDRIWMRNATTGKSHIDLWEANRYMLIRSGILLSHIETAGICTRTYHKEFYSARKLGIASGRFVSGIFLR